MESRDAVAALEALAQDRAWVSSGYWSKPRPDGLPAGRIAERMKLPAPTLSFHLAQLKHAGLLSCRREGTSLIYSAEFAAMNDLVGFMTENCCGGDAARCAPARTVFAIEAQEQAA